VQFVDVARSSGVDLLNVSGRQTKDYIVEVKGGGAATFLDHDGDGDLDLYVINGSDLRPALQGPKPRNALYRNDGAAFVDVAAAAGVADTGWGMGCVAADYDNDGAVDLLVTNFGPDVLFRNRGDGTFLTATDDAGIADARWNTGAAFGDYDLDGDLDLYVVSYIDFDQDYRPQDGQPNVWRGVEVMYGPQGLPGEPDVLYRNEGDGRFVDVTTAARVVDEGRYNGFAALFTDFDDDGDPDLFVADDSTPNMLYRNEGDGTFREIGRSAGVAYSSDGVAQAGMGADAGDFDGDGDLDIVVTNFADDYNTLYRNDGQGFFTDATLTTGDLYRASFPFVSWGVGFLDYDNDADLDLFVANGHVYPQVDAAGIGSYRQPNQVFRNDGGQYLDVSRDLGAGLRIEAVSRGASFGDYDRDGDIDVAIVNIDSRPTLLRNDGGNRGHWLQVELEGDRSNRDGIGSRVWVEAAGKVQVGEVRAGGSFLSGSDLRLHFGLGAATRVARVVVRWPSGVRDTLRDVAADRLVVIGEGRGERARGPTGAAAR
jgi:hypothetical protein